MTVSFNEGKITGVTTSVPLSGSSITSECVVVQNWPDSTGYIYVGSVNARLIKLAPGQSQTIITDDVSHIYVEAVTGSATVAWISGNIGMELSSVNTVAPSGASAVTVADGADVAQGATTDAAVTTDITSTISSKLRGLVKILNDVWDSANHRLLAHVGGTSAAGVADSGNPVKVGYKYNSVAPVLVDGQRGDAQGDVNSNLKATLATLISGEDQTNNRMIIAQKFLMTTAVAAATTPIKSGAGILKRVIFPTLVASATCKIYDNTAASGTVLLDTVTIPSTVTGVDPFFIELDLSFSTGCTVVMTGTAFVGDIVYM